MKKRSKRDDDMPVGPLRIVEDFLPPPEELIALHNHIKVTLLLDRQSVDFFKSCARRIGTKYQRMMREVLKRYARLHTPRRAA
jgi:hypothetical protein